MRYVSNSPALSCKSIILHTESFGMESLKKYGVTDVVFSSVRDLTLEKVKELFKHGKSNISLTETPDLDGQTETTEIEP